MDRIASGGGAASDPWGVASTARLGKEQQPLSPPLQQHEEEEEEEEEEEQQQQQQHTRPPAGSSGSGGSGGSTGGAVGTTPCPGCGHGLALVDSRDVLRSAAGMLEVGEAPHTPPSTAALSALYAGAPSVPQPCVGTAASAILTSPSSAPRWCTTQRLGLRRQQWAVRRGRQWGSGNSSRQRRRCGGGGGGSCRVRLCGGGGGGSCRVRLCCACACAAAAAVAAATAGRAGSSACDGHHHRSHASPRSNWIPLHAAEAQDPVTQDHRRAVGCFSVACI